MNITNSSYKIIQKHVSLHIHSAAFQYLKLPILSPETWDAIQTDDAECSRLGFLGDALMNTFVAECIYRVMKQQGDAGVFTAARSALTSNQTFGQIMRRLGCSDAQGKIQKSEADVFETIVGGYFKEKGADLVKEWQETNYTPLVHHVAQICRSLVPARRKKRKRILIPRPLMTTPTLGMYPLFMHYQLKIARRPQIATTKSLMISPLKDRLKSRKRSRLLSTRPSNANFSGKATSPIDLTVDSDWEDTDDIVEVPPPEPHITKPLPAMSSVGIFVTTGSCSNPIIVD
ncbi:hypothetical protein VKT23_003318 [Stygiomarasmius scandens]|uniref:RNase III domain-containing protein n=1 Tax=Marasmiellus scandens TaxID=2682957 RepID=A0ABR1JYK4_9AGAR